LDIHEKFSWGLSKDDVSPKDIFEMTKKDHMIVVSLPNIVFKIVI